MARTLRGFVGLSLVLGGALLLEEARLFRALPGGGEWLYAVVAAWALALTLVTLLVPRKGGPWSLVAAVLLGSLLAAIAWAHFEVNGHLVLSGLAPVVAVLAGVGILRAERWGWAVGFAIVSGVGPLFLSFAPLSEEAYAGALVLFLMDALALLALADSFFRGDVR